jgi:DNA-binding transcriptional MerR regulator
MDGMTISDAAHATGFTASALRFYENAGLINPARTGTGYRRYGDADLITLRFIGRAKRPGLSLEEIAELVPLLGAGWCGPVQDQLRAFVVDKIDETRQRTGDLIGLLGQLQAVAARLGRHTPDGMCDEHCGCTTDDELPAAAGGAARVVAP